MWIAAQSYSLVQRGESVGQRHFTVGDASDSFESIVLRERQ